MVGTAQMRLCPPYQHFRRMTVFAGSASFRSEHNGGRLDLIREVSSQEDHEIATSVVERARRIHASPRHRRRLAIVTAADAICGGTPGDRTGRTRCDDRGAEAAEAAA